MKEILIMIIAYNAQAHIAALLARIPREIFAAPGYRSHVLLLDDASTDQTLETAKVWLAAHPMPATLVKNAANLGYGGNQKRGYAYALEHGYDAVLMLHGDGQYPPEMIDAMIQPLLRQEADAVLGSRMLQKGEARRGGMPLYKWIGNKTLTHIQNLLLHSRLSEFHTGFRAYSTALLRSIPFEKNSDDFDFDTDILIQCIAAGKRIHEIPIPTHYGDEICHVNGVKYACQVIRSTLQYRLHRAGLRRHAKFDTTQHP